MKILLTVHQFFPKHRAGTEVLTLETARELQRQGHDVLIVAGAFSPTPLADEERFTRYEYEGLQVVCFAASPGPCGGQANVTQLEFYNPLFAQKFAEVLDEFQPDIVHFFHLMRLSSTFIDICVERGVPTIATTTDFWFVCPMAQLLLPNGEPCQGPDHAASNCIRHFTTMNQRGTRIAALATHLPDFLLYLGSRAAMRNWHFRLRLPTPLLTVAENARAIATRPHFLKTRLNLLGRVLLPTRLMERVLGEHGLEPNRGVYLPFGINLDYVQRLPRQESPRLSVAFIGTLAPHKGAHVLIEAVKQLLPDTQVALDLYGNPDEFPDYMKQLRQQVVGDDRFCFRGTFPNQEIGAVFARHDVLVVPSLWYENTPLVIYSAQACGCPVVASDFPGMSEAVRHEDNGLLFPAGDVAALASTLSRLYHEPGLRNRLAANAKPPLSIRDYVAAILQHYAELIAEKAGV